MEPHCATLDALLKVHDRIVEEDRFGGVTFDDDNKNSVVTTRLLVPNNMLCMLLLGNLLVLKIYTLNMSMYANEGPVVHVCSHFVPVKSAAGNLWEGQASFNLSCAFLSPRNPMLSNRAPSHTMSPMPQEDMKTVLDLPKGGFNGFPPGHGAGTFGGIIDKGGFNVKQLQLETGAKIHKCYLHGQRTVHQLFAGACGSRICQQWITLLILFQALWNPRSQIIVAVLELQNRTSEFR
ncbi:unnamed protein product [Malus baccata var. baccata]